MAKSALTESEILALIEEEEQAAYGVNDTELSTARAEAIADYLGDPNRFPAGAGRSKVVSFDTQDTIESALPQLLKIFVSGDQVVKFEPRGPEDQQAAEQETDYINYVVMEKNNGFSTFYTWFKDAMLSKNGYVKVWYEEEKEVEKEGYFGLTDEQLAMILQNENVEVLEHTEYPDPTYQGNAAQMMQMGAPIIPQPMLHDVKIAVSETRGCIKIMPVAPEDMYIASDCRTVSVKNARFVQHRCLKSPAELREEGYEVPENVDYESFFGFDEEERARNLYGEDDELNRDISEAIVVRDTYYRIDGELKRYVIAGKKILATEDCEIMPFAVITPHIMPHRHIGRSYHDLVKDVQATKTALIRGQLDNMYLANNGRYGVDVNNVNLEDLLTSRPGGVIRFNGPPSQSFAQITHPSLPPQSFSMIEYMDSIKEKRTGVTAYNQGLDSNSLNKTATGVNAIMGAAQERIALVARCFAETGVKELFMLVHHLVRKYYTKPEMIRLRNEWVEVDPRTWKTRADMSIAVGLGTGNKDQQLMHLTTMYQMAVQDMAIGVTTPENIYNIRRQLAINSGFKNPEEFITNPAQQPPQPPRPDPEQIKIQGQMQMEQMKIQADVQKFQAQTTIEQQKAQQNLIQEQARSQNDVQIEREKIAAQMQFEQWKAQLDAQVALEKSRMDAEAKMAVEQYKAESAMKQQRMAQLASEGMEEDEEGNIRPGKVAASIQAGLNEALQGVTERVQELLDAHRAPKTIERGPDGRPISVGGRMILRGPDGKVMGLQ